MFVSILRNCRSHSPSYGYVYIGRDEYDLCDVVKNLLPEKRKEIKNTKHIHVVRVSNGQIYLNGIHLTRSELSLGKIDNSHEFSDTDDSHTPSTGAESSSDEDDLKRQTKRAERQRKVTEKQRKIAKKQRMAAMKIAQKQTEESHGSPKKQKT